MGSLDESINNFLKRINKIRSKKDDDENFVVAGNQVNDVCIQNNSITSMKTLENKGYANKITILSLICKKEQTSKRKSVLVTQMVLPEKSLNFKTDHFFYDNIPLIDRQTFSKVFEEKVKKLKQSLPTTSSSDFYNTIAFLNSNRVTDVNNKLANRKAKQFKRDFPNVPIFGCLGVSQIGHDFFPGCKNDDLYDYEAKFYDHKEDFYPPCPEYETNLFTVICLAK
jgi:hypothetical protein